MAHLLLEVIKQIPAETTWPLRHQVMWPDLPFDFIKLPEDPDGAHFGLFKNQELVSIVSLFKTAEGTAQFRKFATKSTEQGKGYGTKLLTHLIEYTQKQKYHTVWCNARIDKTDFYKKFGMYETEETFIKQNIRFVILKKVF